VIVAKFGGTSVADADAIARTADIIRGRLHRQPVVVVSAMAGVTNELLALAEQAVAGQLISAIHAIEVLRTRHFAETELLLGGSPAAVELCAEMSVMFDELANLAGALAVLGHLTPRSLDTIAAMGELLNSQLVVAAYNALGVPATLIDPRQVMITDDQFTRAMPLTEAIVAATRALVLPVIREGRVPVLGGFVGATAGGITTTLGRGGSDYTAALLGAALDAEAIEIWTDVDGMLTADPRVVTGARLIEQIRFEEASELASFGAKVLHPMTIAPAVRKGIPVFIYNSRRPEGVGTRITFDAPRRPVTAIAGKSGTSVVKVRSSRMLLTHGFLRMIFEVFERHKTSVDVVATSEVSVSLTVDQAERLDGVLLDLAALGDVSVERSRGIIAIVGAGLSDDSGAMSTALRALAGFKIHMLSLSATGINLTIIVDGDQVASAMRALHTAFFQ
jgi:aspartate kinase